MRKILAALVVLAAAVRLGRPRQAVQAGRLGEPRAPSVSGDGRGLANIDGTGDQ